MFTGFLRHSSVYMYAIQACLAGRTFSQQIKKTKETGAIGFFAAFDDSSLKKTKNVLERERGGGLHP